MKKISYVIPCYRSALTILNVINEISDTMVKLPKYQYEIILVNDCSPDSTFEVIRDLAEKRENVIAVNFAKNFGQHAALMAGFHQVTGDIIVCLDDDGQTPANEVSKLLEQLENGYDVVYASYEHKQHSGFRNLGSRVNSKMTEIMLEKPKNLHITSYFATKRFIVDEMIRYEHCYPYVIGLVLRSTKNICNIPVTHREREEGRSGYTITKLISLWLNGFTSFSVKPLRMATYFGAFSAFCGFIYLLYIVIKYLAIDNAPVGWSSTIAVILLMGGVILVVLGLIGEYVGRIYMCANAAPQFVIRDIVGKKNDDEKD
ncbi:MAG: glycosyltransferase family 2 protein [Lachnospiraceae bacterium]|nr:glycosyltransferase family 2 protein [Lachnospiraceae bacterium]